MTSVLTPLQRAYDTQGDDLGAVTARRPPLPRDPAAGAVRPARLRPLPPGATRADRAARAVLLRLLEHLDGGRLTLVEPDGTRSAFGQPGADGLDVTVELRTSAVWREVATKAS
ncbi:MAG: hypothetical protein KDA98_10500, partial [Acidimicrobiales bacterium]|nr:hypothetical protein [Acidimicrobiales bacterium]